MDKSPKRRTSITLPTKIHDKIMVNAKSKSRSTEIVSQLEQRMQEFRAEDWSFLMSDWKPSSKEGKQQSYLSPTDELYEFLDKIKEKTRLDRSQIVEFLLSYSYGLLNVPVRAIIVLGGKGIQPSSCPKIIPENICSSRFIFVQNIRDLHQKYKINDFLIIHTEDNRTVIQEAVEQVENDLPKLKGKIILYGQDNTDMGEEFVLNKIFETHFFVRKAHTIFVMWGNVIVKDFNIRKFLAFHLRSKTLSSLVVLSTDPNVNNRDLKPDYYSHVDIQGHEIRAFYPKPVPMEKQTNMLDVGIYLFNRNFFKEAIDGGFKESPKCRLRDLFEWYPKYKPEKISAYPLSAIWYDPGVIPKKPQASISNNRIAEIK
ncbi:MAG: sugar phosphate nucleotidyltransferase [Candidatus Hermodarchaeota archaeon]